jgi:sugar lactone lactonase YvrE
MQNSRNIFFPGRIPGGAIRTISPLVGILAMFCGLWIACSANAQTTYENYTFVTVAGAGDAGVGWLDGIGPSARFGSPTGVARDGSGNLYIADSFQNTIRKIAPDGTVTTLAGLAGFSGTNDGIGAAARFNGPYGIAVGSDGTVYVADTKNQTIRKISPGGVVTTLAGSAGHSGTANGTGTAAQFSLPRGLVVDAGNNLFVADTSNDAIRKITPAGVVTTFAGSIGNPGSANKTGTSAGFNLPVGITIDAQSNLYVADFLNSEIRKITPDAVVSTIAGSVTNASDADGTNSTAGFNGPFGVTINGTEGLYVSDSASQTIRKVTFGGIVATIAGSAGQSGSSNAVGTVARFRSPSGIVSDGQTNLYVCDFGNNCIRQIAPDLTVTVFAGAFGGSGSVDAIGSAARFNFPSDIAFDSNGNAYITDVANDTIRKMAPNGAVTTLAGSPVQAGTNDGVGSGAMFSNPEGLTVDSNGNVFVVDTGNQTIRKITPLGSVSTFAGLALHSQTNDGVGAAARFNTPIGITMDTNGNFFVGDTHNETIRKITPDATVTTFAGTANVSGTNDGPALSAQFGFPEGLAFDGNGNLYVADSDNSSVRKIAVDGSVSTLAGTPTINGSADGTGTAAFRFPFGLATDSSGNVYIGDTDNSLVRKITPAGIVTTIGGVAGQFGNFDGTGSDALFSGPEGIAVDSQGNVYVADAGNHSIRKGYPALPDMPVVDRIGAPPGVTRHFSISNETTTSWSWSFIRKPAGSSAQIVGTNTDAPTFTPDIDDIYEIRFQGWDNSGHTTIRRFTLYADDTAPAITITNPAAGMIASNGVFSVAGTTTDDLGVSNVFVQLNGGPWKSATGTTNWAVIENLVAVTNGLSTNIIRAYSQDFAGNVSATNEIDLPYILSDRLKVVVKGGGTLVPNLNGVFLQISNTYSITVKPASGSTFSNWTASLGSGTNSQTITFVMQSNLTLTANCIDHAKPTIAITFPKPSKFFKFSNLFVIGTAKDNDSVTNVFYQLNGGAWTNATGTSNWFANLNLNPGANTLLVYAQDPTGNRSATNRFTLNFLPTAIGGGNYAGLFFDTNNLTATNAGFFSATLAPAGTFTAKLLLGGGTIPFSGQFSNDGVYSNSFVAKGFNTPFTVQLQLDLSGAGTITGTIANSGWSCPLLANQDVFSVANPPSQQFQQFSLVIPGDENSTNQPGGNSAGTIILDGVGGVSFKGSLADGSPAAQKTFISRNGNWPFYISSSGGQGVMLGWLNFSFGQKGNLTGQLYWERLPQADASLYPAGFNFTNGITVVGSYFDYFVSVPTLIVPNGGQVVLQQADISPPLTNYFTLTAHGLNDFVSSTNNLKLTITFSTGAFKGSVVNPANNLTIPISGAILTNQNAGFGFFINSNQSGSVFISTNAP